MQKPFALLIKPASADCNMRCSYCYYLPKADLYPKSSVHRMPKSILTKIIAGYMATRQPQYTFIWQGGEPTLMGVGFFREAVILQKRFAQPGAVISNVLQTNGMLIDDALSEFFHKYRFLIGISLDGPQNLHDKYRRTVNGKGAHTAVLEGIKCLNRNSVQFNVVVTVSSHNVGHGRKIYRYLRDIGCRYLQYIPCAEFAEKDGITPGKFTVTGEQWGNFLCEVFDEWQRNDAQKVSVRLFDSVMNYLLNGQKGMCSMKRSCNSYFMVEYNGDIYPCDFYAGAEYLLGNIVEKSWTDVYGSADFADFSNRKAKWSTRCERCSYLDLCAGDCMRYRILPAAPGDDSLVSWFCEGWEKFYSHSLQKFNAICCQIRREKQKISSRQGTPSIPKVGRNQPCPCGSSLKYKKCCGR